MKKLKYKKNVVIGLVIEAISFICLSLVITVSHLNKYIDKLTGTSPSDMPNYISSFSIVCIIIGIFIGIYLMLLDGEEKDETKK